MTAARSFFEQPILNSPYEEPSRYHPLDDEGQPLNEPPREGRRKSELITAVPKPRKRKRKTNKDQASLGLHDDDGVSSEEQEYNPTPIINEIRSLVGQWRRSSQAAWGVTKLAVHFCKAGMNPSPQKKPKDRWFAARPRNLWALKT